VMHAPSPTHVILVALGEPADRHPEQLRRIREAVTDANVLLVTPALPVPGERWIVDLDARESQARARLQRWIGALAGRPSAIEAQVGDADPRTAVADARRELPAARVVDAPAIERDRTAEPGRAMRLAERYGLMPAPVAAGP
jgi:hypothetical protein